MIHWERMFGVPTTASPGEIYIFTGSSKHMQLSPSLLSLTSITGRESEGGRVMVIAFLALDVAKGYKFISPKLWTS